MNIKLHLGKIAGIIIGFFSGLGLIGVIVGILLGTLIDKINYSRQLKKLTLNLLTEKPPQNFFVTRIKQNDYFNIILAVIIISFFNKQNNINKQDLESIKWELKKYPSINKKDIFLLNTIMDLVFEKKSQLNLNTICNNIKNIQIKLDFPKILRIISKLSNKKLGFNDFKFLLNTLISEKELNTIVLEIYPEIIKQYEVLGINPGTAPHEIKKTYRKLAIQFHPDKLNNLELNQKKQAKEAFLKIKTAYEEIIKEYSL